MDFEWTNTQTVLQRGATCKVWQRGFYPFPPHRKMNRVQLIILRSSLSESWWRHVKDSRASFRNKTLVSLLSEMKALGDDFANRLSFPQFQFQTLNFWSSVEGKTARLLPEPRRTNNETGWIQTEPDNMDLSELKPFEDRCPGGQKVHAQKHGFYSESMLGNSSWSENNAGPAWGRNHEEVSCFTSFICQVCILTAVFILHGGFTLRCHVKQPSPYSSLMFQLFTCLFTGFLLDSLRSVKYSNPSSNQNVFILFVGFSARENYKIRV